MHLLAVAKCQIICWAELKLVLRRWMSVRRLGVAQLLQLTLQHEKCAHTLHIVTVGCPQIRYRLRFTYQIAVFRFWEFFGAYQLNSHYSFSGNALENAAPLRSACFATCN